MGVSERLVLHQFSGKLAMLNLKIKMQQNYAVRSHKIPSALKSHDFAVDCEF